MADFEPGGTSAVSVEVYDALVAPNATVGPQSLVLLHQGFLSCLGPTAGRAKKPVQVFVACLCLA